MEFLVVILVIGFLWAILKGVTKAGKSHPRIPRPPAERKAYLPQSDSIPPVTGSYVTTSSGQVGFRRSTAVWNPPGSTVEICGYQIKGGMIYTGSRMERVAGYGVEPALINPELSRGRAATGL